MKKQFLVLIFLFGQTAMAQTYSFWCRGPLAFRNSPAYTLAFDYTKAASSAKDPQSLQPGTCAWEDRAVNAAEPTSVIAAMFDPSTSNDAETMVIRTANFQKDVAILTSSLSNSENLLNIQVEGDGHFLSVAKNPAVRFFKVVPFKK